MPTHPRHHRPRNPIVITATLFVIASLFDFRVAVAADNPLDVRDEIRTIGQDVAAKQKARDEVQKKAADFHAAISQKKAEAASIEDQIAWLDNDAARLQLDIQISEREIDEYNLELGVLGGQVDANEKKLAYQKTLLMSLMRKLYAAEADKSPLEMLFSDKSFSEYFTSIQSLADLQSGIDKSLETIHRTSLQLAADKKEIQDKKLAIQTQQSDEQTAKLKIDDERNAKQSLLIETKSSELDYRYQLAELQQEQNQADSEIQYLEKVLRDKKALADELAAMPALIAWPVSPARGISTKFRDPDYPFRSVYEHPGIDIRADQGTPVHAAAAGIVARAKDAGYGYSYVMIMHSGNVSTVYGHLSKIIAKEDTFVEKGEIIGFSGGMPGTPGAGRLTTGPHLHFETRYNGVPVDPMRYLGQL